MSALIRVAESQVDFHFSMFTQKVDIKKNVYEYMCMLQGLVEMINHESKYRQVCMFACVYEEYITWARCIFEQRLPRYMSMYECM